MNELSNNIKLLINDFNKSIEIHLPILETKINNLIVEKCTNNQTIETLLDVLLSLTVHGFGNELYIQLINYYKSIDKEGALFYWNQYDNKDD